MTITNPPAAGLGPFLTIAALAIMLVSTPAMAMEDGPQNVVTVDLLNSAKGMGMVEYQRLIWRDYAWKARVLSWSMKTEKWAVAANGIGGGIRHYTQGTAPEGGYMEASLDVAQISADASAFAPPGIQKSFYLMPTGSVGYSWFHEQFFAEITLGVRYMMMGSIQPKLGKYFPLDGPLFFFTISFGLPF
jgi:hypothetical protein